MGRARAQKDPFWATSLLRMQAHAADIVEQLLAVIRQSPDLAPYCWMGSGWRTGSVEHSSGRAIDIMITRTTGRRPTPTELRAGNLLVDWLVANFDRLGIQGLIFSRDSRNRPEFYGYTGGRFWRAGKDRGGISGNHVDHIHILFKPSARWPSALNSAVIGAQPDPRTDIERLLDAMDKNELTDLIRAAVRAERNSIAEATNTAMLTDREWRLYGADGYATLPHAVFSTERAARNILTIVQDLAGAAGVRVDEAALAQTIATLIAPSLKQAVKSAVEAGGTPDAIADAVLTRMGAALTEA